MWLVAFTLGLFGSLHCVGMCGPLAIAFCDKDSDTKLQRFFSGLSYNLGRALTYSILGLGISLVGSFIYLVDLQKLASILLGILMVVSFVFSIDIDKKINAHPYIAKIYGKIRVKISKMYRLSKKYPPLVLGMANGLLPCGLVYLALMGALASEGILNGMLFMFAFGIGTIPMMLTLVFGSKFISPNMRYKFKKFLPYVT
ncbi:MAG: sulfite exporter TauE/SafE family protein, partial [Saprospiraceae bacterium]